MHILDQLQTYEKRKQDAYSFLKSLENRLNSSLPAPNELRTEIRKIVRDSKSDDLSEHLRLPESAFLNRFIMRPLFELVSAHDGMDISTARKAILCEYKRMRQQYGSGSPARKLKHPFKKVLGSKPSTIMQQWQSGRGLTQSCPDICTRDPFFKIVFEVKYFEKGGRDRAVTELVTSIYQAFFYLGLPHIPSQNSLPAWDYEFACLLAGDVSEGGSLQKAWEAIHAVQNAFWEGANIYVMIVRGPSPKRA